MHENALVDVCVCVDTSFCLVTGLKSAIGTQTHQMAGSASYMCTVLMQINYTAFSSSEDNYNTSLVYMCAALN